MTPQEAYSILEVSSDISESDLKSKFKKLAAKYHPDVFKDEPDKFRKINEAYQTILDYREHPEKYEERNFGNWSSVGVNLGDIFFGNASPFFRRADPEEDNSYTHFSPIELQINVSFEESILGCDKQISYHRFIKCAACDGKGAKYISNGCDSCDGFGRVIKKSHGMIMQSSCSKCASLGVKKEECKVCKRTKTAKEEINGNISIPPGAKNNDVLRLANRGHFIGKTMFHDQYTDVLIKVKVPKHDNMWLSDINVYSDCYITLLEALEGSSKTIDTVYGEKEIIVPIKSKNLQELVIDKCGVKGTDGKHIVRLIVDYPDDVAPLVKVLKDGISNSV